MADTFGRESRGPTATGFGNVRDRRIRVCCRMRPLLDSEVESGQKAAPWKLTDTTIALLNKKGDSSSSAAPRETVRNNDRGGVLNSKSEVRNMEHLKRDESETLMDFVFGSDISTGDVYKDGFSDIVCGAAEGLNGAILAYGQTSSGKTHSISGAGKLDEYGIPEQKGILHYAVEDLFHRIRENTADAGGNGTEYLVSLSYAELYMERVNDLLRKISPQSQNLPVKEDADTRSFFVEGIKEKIVSSPEQVYAIVSEAEKRRRVAYTRYNEVSSRSHTILSLNVECTAPLQGSNDDDGCANAPMVTRVGKLFIVDLAGNERIDAGTEYMAESNSINKSLFFLGEVISKLAQRDAVLSEEDKVARNEGPAHVPYRDSKLTRLLSVHLGGNSRTGILVTLHPAEEFIEQSSASLRFAQKAATIRCVAKPVLVSKEQSLILRQREIIHQLRAQVKDLEAKQQEALEGGQHSGFEGRGFEGQPMAEPQPDRSETPPPNGSRAIADCSQRPPSGRKGSFDNKSMAAEKRQQLQELQSMTVGQQSAPKQFISRSQEVDAIVTALHKTNEALRQQKATVLEEIKGLHQAVNALGQEITTGITVWESSGMASPPPSFVEAAPAANQKKPWAAAIMTIRERLDEVFGKASGQVSDVRDNLAAVRCDAAIAQQERDMAEAKLIEVQRNTPRQESKALQVAVQPKPRGEGLEQELLKSAKEQLRASMEENSTLRKAFSQAGTELKKLEEENATLREQAPTRAWGSTAASSFAGNSYLRDSSDSFRASPLHPSSTPFLDSSRFGDSMRPPPSGMVPGTGYSGYGGQEVLMNSELRRLEDENMRLRTALVSTAGSGLRPPNAGAQQLSAEEAALREENAKLRKSMRTLNEEKKHLKAEVTQLRVAEKAQQEIDPCTSGPASFRTPGQNKIGSSEVSTRPGSGSTASGPLSGDPSYAAAVSPVKDSWTSPKQSSSPRNGSNKADLGYSFGDFEPIVERTSLLMQAQPPAPTGPVPGCNGAQPPKPGFGRGGLADMAPKMTMDYYRQMGIRTTWRPGDVAYRRGEPCQVIQIIWDEQPPHVIVRTPEGTEVSTEFCLLSEGPATNKYGPTQTPPSPARPSKLAPLGDLLLDRPPMPPSPGQLPAVVPRSSSLPARGMTDKLQPIGSLPRQNAKIPGSSSRCASPGGTDRLTSYTRSLSRSPLNQCQ